MLGLGYKMFKNEIDPVRETPSGIIWEVIKTS